MLFKVTIDEVRNPVPLMVSVCGVDPAVNKLGESELMVGTGVLGTETATDAAPDLVVSSAEIAVIVAVPDVVGVKTPDEVIAPSVAVQFTAELKAPVPCTAAEQVEVCVVSIEAGEQATETEVIVTGMVTVTVAEPDFVVSSVDVAIMVAVPAPVGKKTPAVLTVPMLVGLTDHATVEL